ncbi:MAG TPA: glycosyltransferase [Vicinamibacterales bacterium]
MPPTKVTVAIPAYNHGRYVAEAIESVLAQDHPAIELIVVDDGSTDDTGQVLAAYTNRVHVISQHNSGQSSAINTAWRMASGDIVSYLSADDRLEPGAVGAAVSALANAPEAVMAYGDYNLIDPASNFIRRVTSPEFDYTSMVGDLVCAPGPGVFVRRSAAQQIEGWNPDLRQTPDFEYWLRLSLLGPFVKIPRVLAGLRVHPESASFAPTTPTRADEPVRIMEAYFERTDLPGSALELRRQSMSAAHLLAARAHLRAGRVRMAGTHVRAAGRLSPGTLASRRSARLLFNALFNRAGHRLLWYVRRTTRQTR